MKQTAISIQNVSKRYKIGVKRSSSFRETLGNAWKKNAEQVSNEFWALKDVSFDVAEGEIVGIMGKNGAGKSTILKILSKITPLTKGRIEIDGRVASLLEVGTGFHAELTGMQNIFLNGTILGMTRKEIKNKLDQIIDFAGISQFINTPVKHYSSGMYVRLAFSVAAHLEPEILIVDEVLAVGDIEFQKKCLGKMQEVSQNSGRTILFVSHNLASLKSLCQRGVVLSRGQKVYDGEIVDAIDHYVGLSKSSTEENKVSVREAHVGTMELEVTKIDIGTRNGTVSVGEEVDFRFEYIIHDKNFNFNGCHWGVQVHDDDNNLIFSHGNQFIDVSFNHDQFVEGKYFKFSIRNFPFKPGQYWLSYNVVDQNRYMDSMDSALGFEVHSGLPFNYQKEFKSGISAVDATWEVI